MLSFSTKQAGRIALARHLARAFTQSPASMAMMGTMAMARNYSIKPPVYKSGNFLLSALNYVKDVEQYQEELGHSASEAQLAAELLARIREQPQLLYLLLLFHSELRKLGITATSPRDFGTAATFKYRVLYMLKLAKIHNIFWTQCQYLSISERLHTLGFLPGSIGVLDPKNFGAEACAELQRGVYGGTDFRDVEMLGRRTFDA